jgi:hypothetical protein
VKKRVLKAVGAVPKTGFLKNGSYDFLKNTRFGMWEMSPKAQFLCCFQLYKLPLKTNRDSRPFQQAIIRQKRLRNRFRRAF